MFNLVLGFISRIGGFKVAGMALACILPLLLLQCSRSSLEDLRGEYRALEAEYAALQGNLARCREAASLHDLVLMERERETGELTNKYNKLREEFLRGLLNAENNDAFQETPGNNPDRALAAGSESFKAWCAQPLPALVRELLAEPRAEAGTTLPAASGRAPHGDAAASSSRP